MKSLPKFISSAPMQPGIYLMKDEKGNILYIGKSKNLKKRITSYFSSEKDTRPFIPFLISHVSNVETIVVNNETEALLLENTLIKKHQPKYNALLKDDKTFFTLAIDTTHPWPFVQKIRSKQFIKKKGHLVFGPYTNSETLRHTLNLLYSFFPLRQCSDQEFSRRKKPCLLYDLQKCLAPCVNKCSSNEYQELLDQAILLLEHKNIALTKQLQELLKEAIEQLLFEKAKRLHANLNILKKNAESQNIENIQVSHTDALGIYRKNLIVVVSKLVFREHKLVNVELFTFLENTQEDPEIISSFILQHYKIISDIPKEILLPCSLETRPYLEKLFDAQIKLSYPQKGKKRRLIEIALLNAKNKLEEISSKKLVEEQVIQNLTEWLKFKNYPERIECFDASHLSGAAFIGVITVFSQGTPLNKFYRTFKIRTATDGDDYGALAECLTRRFKMIDNDSLLPNLLIIDGGRQHWNIANKTLTQLGLTQIDIIAICKENHRHDKGLSQEKIFNKAPSPLILPPASAELFFLQKIRDETHRFALYFQKKCLRKQSLKTEIKIKGIGPSKTKKILTYFGSWQEVFKKSPTEWANIPGLSQKDLETLSDSKRLFS
ncbi:UvrABC system protein C [Candidatus Clavichlamydia salmonicola]|uniref:excinuclease ABC subunit UvrC n=1 Tax=Candidatus Clavichlamydia salmonicola TaxID=469812 RepID=UPI001891BF27|nr:excinuclease ABC subunit UvrC [Candidatus Clavichlamydia salmonicola]MBF5050472.1 UvrABC system protein C [Candidatus Clavichlamydia salmonicola]